MRHDKNMGTLHLAKKTNQVMHACICVGIYIITPEMKSVFEEDSLVREIICGKTPQQ